MPGVGFSALFDEMDYFGVADNPLALLLMSALPLAD